MGGLSGAADEVPSGPPATSGDIRRDACLSPSQIERLAASEAIHGGEAASAAEERSATELAAVHLASCPRCAAMVAEARESRRFLGTVGALLRGAGHEPRARSAAGRSGSGEAKPATARPSSDAIAVGGRLLHGYRLLAPIGHGGQGAVWRAVHEPSGRTAAVKIVRFASPRERARMQREARVAAGLRHPGIVAVFDCGALPDAGFAIAMELVEGRPLDAWARRLAEEVADSRLRTRRIVRVVARLCAALHHAHQHGVIHRDLKPGNVIVGPDDQPRLVDFGLARAAEPGSGATLTRTGEFAGTLVYAAPEQVRGDCRVGSPADIYATGIVLYELLVGRLPFHDGGPIDAVAGAVLRGVATVPSRSVRDEPIDRDLATVVLKAIDADPGRRYESAAALRADLERWLEGRPVEARRASTWYVLGKAVRRHRAAAAVLAIALATLATFSVVVTVLYVKADQAQQRFRSLFDAAKTSTEQATQVYRQADRSLGEVSALYAQESQARREAMAEARRLASELASANRLRARELAAAGERDAARAIAWREALAPPSPAPGVVRRGTPRFLATLALLRELYDEEAAAADLRVDDLIAQEVNRWIERLIREGVPVTNAEEACSLAE